jgi:LPXTG cell wall anchor motif
MSPRRLVPALAVVAAQLLWAPTVGAAGAAVTTRTTSSSTSTTRSTTSTTTPASPGHTRPPLPSCREVVASSPKGTPHSGPLFQSKLLPIGPPQGRRLTAVLRLFEPANLIEIRNCISLRSPSGEEEVTIQDERSTCCAYAPEDHRYTILLPHELRPGTRFCVQTALRDTWFNGYDDPSFYDYEIQLTNRVCAVMPSAGSAGQLPFTGPAHVVPLASLAALAIGVGAALLFLTRRRSPFGTGR